MSREVAPIVQEREVVNGHDQRCTLGRHRECGRVDDVDGSGCALHGWPTQRVPRLIQRDAGERQLMHLRSRRPGLWWQRVVSGGDRENLDIVALLQRLHGLKGRRGGAAGHRVPQLLEGDCDTQSRTTHDRPLTTELMTDPLITIRSWPVKDAGVHRSTRMARPASWSASIATSASTINRASSGVRVLASQPSTALAFEASPRKLSTSAGRK